MAHLGMLAARKVYRCSTMHVKLMPRLRHLFHGEGVISPLCTSVLDERQHDHVQLSTKLMAHVALLDEAESLRLRRLVARWLLLQVVAGDVANYTAGQSAITSERREVVGNFTDADPARPPET